jgi:hypothetical protein
MTAVPFSPPPEQAIPETRAADERERAARHAHRERADRERDRPAFRRVAILASIPGLSRPT